MVSVGDNLFGSQFFITLDEDLDYLVSQVVFTQAIVLYILLLSVARII
jgi:hypothetical protein